MTGRADRVCQVPSVSPWSPKNGNISAIRRNWRTGCLPRGTRGRMRKRRGGIFARPPGFSRGGWARSRAIDSEYPSRVPDWCLEWTPHGNSVIAKGDVIVAAARRQQQLHDSHRLATRHRGSEGRVQPPQFAGT